MRSTWRGKDARAIPDRLTYLRRRALGIPTTALVTSVCLAIASCAPHPSMEPPAVAECPKSRQSNLSDSELLFEVRRLQSTLMVAALRCDARPHYNEFVTVHKSALQENGRTLKQEFQRRHGRAGQREMDKFVTVLANEASARSNADYLGKRSLAYLIAVLVRGKRSYSPDPLAPSLCRVMEPHLVNPRGWSGAGHGCGSSHVHFSLVRSFYKAMRTKAISCLATIRLENVLLPVQLPATTHCRRLDGF
jgi:hypothetical protein